MIQEFEIPGRLDGLNEYTAACRTSSVVGCNVKRKNQDVVCRAIRAARLRHMRTPVDIYITWIEGVKPGVRSFRPRDKDNIAFAKKFVLDALVEEGVIKDDGFRCIGSLSDKFLLNRNHPLIIVRLENDE